MILVSLCAETIKTVFEGDKSDSCGGKCISLSSASCKPYNQCEEGGVIKGMDMGLNKRERGGGWAGNSIFCTRKL